MGAGGRVAVIGAGKMGETLLGALLEAGADPRDLVATALHRERVDAVGARFGIETTLDNLAAVEGAEVVLVCVKPQAVRGLLAELAPALGPEQLLVSIAAGVTIPYLERHVGQGVPVVRAMPNTPSQVGAGMTAICGGRHATPEHVERARELFDRVGRTVLLDEKHFDAVTGLSASGPAFLYVVIESLAEGGVKAGLPRDVATELAAQACLGAARMVIETRQHPAVLKDHVTTPAGCTMDGILELEQGGLRVTLIKTIVEATRRARELAPEE